MLSLFPELDSLRDVPVDPFAAVPGLSRVRDFVTPSEEAALMLAAANEEWNCQWSRRTQFYGESYTSAGRGTRYPDIPLWADDVRRRLVDRGIVPAMPTQMGVNEYLPGQGIAPHIDYSGGYVVSLSLGSGCVMEFTHTDHPDPVALYLEPRSIVVLTGDARNIWKHGIPGRKSDRWNGLSVPRNLRVSLTFRNLSCDAVGETLG